MNSITPLENKVNEHIWNEYWLIYKSQLIIHHLTMLNLV